MEVPETLQLRNGAKTPRPDKFSPGPDPHGEPGLGVIKLGLRLAQAVLHPAGLGRLVIYVPEFQKNPSAYFKCHYRDNELTRSVCWGDTRAWRSS